jgi:hypothetical protein
LGLREEGREGEMGEVGRESRVSFFLFLSVFFQHSENGTHWYIGVIPVPPAMHPTCFHLLVEMGICFVGRRGQEEAERSVSVEKKRKKKKKKKRKKLSLINLNLDLPLFLFLRSRFYSTQLPWIWVLSSRRPFVVFSFWEWRKK